MKIPFVFLFWMAQMLFMANPAHGQDISFSRQLSAQLNDQSNQSKLYYPKSVKRYYQQNDFKPAWIKNKDEPKQTFWAMMLLDCVLQYGLSHADYHPDALIYDNLQTMIDTPEKVPAQQRARFDILLTDAIITLINHLHYGKMNPDFSAKRIDGIAKASGFNAVNELTKATSERDFMDYILTAQPKSKAYTDLQRYMKLVKGQYVGDCYVVPEWQVRKIAINMERLRWWESSGKNAHERKTPYLTCYIKDGLPVFDEDIRKLDPALEAALYNKAKQVPKKKIPLLLPDIHLKKD